MMKMLNFEPALRHYASSGIVGMTMMLAINSDVIQHC